MSLSTEVVQGVMRRAELIYSETEVHAALDRMAMAMNTFYGQENVLVLGVMAGAMVPCGILLPKLSFPVQLDYIHATRYEGGTVGRTIEWIAHPRFSVKDRHVLVVDDILDGGATLAEIVRHCVEFGAKEVRTAVLLDKYQNREPDGLAHADFVGLQVDNRYVFGFGMDYKEYLRNAPGIYAACPEDASAS